MSTASFTLIYDGPALRDGQIEFRELAGALLAAGKAIEHASRVLNGDKVDVSVHVRAVSPGSCIIDINCYAPMVRQILDFFDDKDVVSISVLLAILGFNVKDTFVGAGRSLISLLKWLKGRRIKRASDTTDGKVMLTLDDGSTVEISVKLLAVFRDIEVRKAISDMTKPLQRDGIELLATKGAEGETEEITKADLAGFGAPQDDEEEELLDEVRRGFFSIVSLAFKDDNKWRLNDGQNVITVSIEDKSFIERIDQNEAFSKNDRLECEIRVRQIGTASGIKTEYTLLKVLDHKRASKQLRLPVDPDKGA